MRRDLLLLGEMIGAADRAGQLVAGLTAEDLQADRLRSESLLWNFTVLGEAAAQVSDELKERFAEIPWQQPTRLRNRIIHGYWSIDMEVLHTTANDQLPSFAADLRKVLHALIADADDAPAPQAGEPRPAGAGDNPSTTAGPPEGTAATDD